MSDLRYPFDRVPEPAELIEVAPGIKWLRMPLPMRLDHINLYLLEDSDYLTIGGVRWRVMVGRGHSPEHACLYSAALNVLISGDQVIPRITSNVSVSPSEPEGNPLRQWLASHQHFLEHLPADALVLPAHNTPFYGLHQRLRPGDHDREEAPIEV